MSPLIAGRHWRCRVDQVGVKPPGLDRGLPEEKQCFRIERISGQYVKIGRGWRHIRNRENIPPRRQVSLIDADLVEASIGVPLRTFQPKVFLLPLRHGRYSRREKIPAADRSATGVS
jgi:hypothetical protein